MLADFSAQVASSGGNLTTTGKITATQLKLARNGSPAPKPVDIDFNLSDNLSSRTGQVNDIAVHTGAVAAHVKGDFRHDGTEAVLNLHLSAPNLPVDQLEQLLPAVGVTLAQRFADSMAGPSRPICDHRPGQRRYHRRPGRDRQHPVDGLRPRLEDPGHESRSAEPRTAPRSRS